MRRDYGGDLLTAAFDIANGFLFKEICICFDNNTTGKEPSSSHKARFFIIILSISATYVINDMYSANLTSLLAKPGREKAINNLNQLEKAMATRGYDLYVERHSSSYSLFENGTGIYGRLWEMMNRRQSHFLLESVEEGVKLVRDTTNKAVIAGRETLFFDIQRFGFILIAEMIYYKHRKKYKRTRRRNKFVYFKKIKNYIVLKVVVFTSRVKRAYRRAMNEAFIATLEYLE
ncbi:glutamate receptor ionotropic, kainate 5, partial [Asbolus verrucosus]